jgi:hypothetical protein
VLLAILLLILTAPAGASFEPGEGPVVEPPPLEVRVGPANLRLRRGEVTAVLVSCRGGVPGDRCAGTVLIGRSNQRDPMAYGAVRYALATGRERLIEVPMKPRARALLRGEADGRHAVVVTATAEGGFPAIRRLILFR